MKTSMPEYQTPLDAALGYARRGWQVFPCHSPAKSGCSCGKADCTSVGKHPQTKQGLKDATTDEARIRAWWMMQPNANVAIRTGADSGLVVLDVDPDKGGKDSLDALIAEYGALPETVACRTGGGGWHYYFQRPDEWLSNSASKLGPGLDIRGDGGYVIAPPSRHASGGRYEWEQSSRPEDTPLAPMPAWLLSLLRNPAPAPSAVTGASVVDPWGVIPEGMRDNTLFSIACSLRGKGLSVPAIEAALQVINTERCEPPLDPAHVKKKAISAGRYEPNTEPTLISHNSLISQPEFPELDDAALYGLAGDIVRLIEPETEASEVAILAQFLVAFGVIVGRIPYYPVEATHHHANLFCVLVGDSSKSRKGTSGEHVRRIFEMVDEDFVKRHWRSGLSSGEGLIWAVRDEIVKWEKSKTGGLPQAVVTDPGIEDKRLLVMESELAQLFKVMMREGNILSPIIRNVWDSGNLSTMTKKDPATATNAHIGIIGHITSTELQRLLNETEAANGFGNRFLWICTKRSKLLPDGGNLSDYALGPLMVKVCEALRHARDIEDMTRDAGASALWREKYAELSKDQHGLSGSLCTRAEAQVLRLSCLYALLDRSATITKAHLEAAMALWDYAEASVRYLFGESLGDPMADEILGLLRQRPEGISRTDLSNNFGRHRKGGEIGATLRRLQDQGLAYSIPKETGGRPVEMWLATQRDAPPSGEGNP